MIKTPPKSFLEKTLSFAKEFGADHAEAVFSEADGVSVSIRLGALEDIQREAKKALGLRVFCGQKTTSLSTTDLAGTVLRDLAEKAVLIAKQSPDDPYSTLPGPGVYTQTPAPDLEIFDPATPGIEALKDLAHGAESAGRDIKGITNSDGASAGWRKNHRIHLTTKGFEGETRSSSFSFHTVLLAGTGTKMERDYDFSAKRFFADLDDPREIGRKAAHRALKRLNPKPVKSQAAPVIYHRRAANTLLGHFAAAINGNQAAKGTTFLEKDLGKQVFSGGIRVIDDPTITRGLASRPFDGEGLAMKPLELIEDGILKTWLLDLSSAAEMSLESNGRANRSLAGAPSPGPTNLYIENGKQSRQALMKTAGRGLLITDLIGMGVNPVTGDYSRGASGFWFEGGEIAYPVSGITIAGNLKNMFRDLEPANDLEFKQRLNAPSLFVPEMTIAGI